MKRFKPPTLEEQRKAAQRELVQRRADEILRNAGHADLTRKGLTGPPEAWRKRGGRRA